MNPALAWPKSLNNGLMTSDELYSSVFSAKVAGLVALWRQQGWGATSHQLEKQIRRGVTPFRVFFGGIRGFASGSVRKVRHSGGFFSSSSSINAFAPCDEPQWNRRPFARTCSLVSDILEDEDEDEDRPAG